MQNGDDTILKNGFTLQREFSEQNGSTVETKTEENVSLCHSYHDKNEWEAFGRLFRHLNSFQMMRFAKRKDRKIVFILFLSDSINWYNCVHCVDLRFYVKQYILKCNRRQKICVHDVSKERLKEAWKKAYLKEARFDGAIWCQR